ncbi:MAG TPA: hypothetical protein GX497_08715 [Bacillus bacterium]|nr:hypothetical protein [Bacillus sp. (in: firmicutes)]
MFEIVGILDITSTYPLYIGILLSCFFVYLFYIDRKQRVRENHALLTNRVRLQSETSLINIEIRINPVITWLFKAVKKYEPDGDDEISISSLI